MALVTDKSGYKSSVSVYNASGERVFTFNSSNRYMIDACVERGGKHVAVATLGSEDAMFVSTIRRYALDQETAVSACVLDDSLLYELSSFGGTLVAVTDDRFLALSGDGSLGGSYDYAYPYLARQHARRDGFRRARALALPLRQRGQVVTVGAEGNLIASPTRSATCWTFRRRAIAVLFTKETSWSSTPSDLAEYASLHRHAVRARRADARRRLGSGAARLAARLAFVKP